MIAGLSAKFIVRTILQNNKMFFASDIRNPLLKFDSTNYLINLYPFYPQFIKKRGKAYEIPQYCNVLAINFIDKSLVLSEKDAWEQRKTFTLKFQEMALLSTVGMRTGKQTTISTIKQGTKQMKEVQKILKIRDIWAEQKVQITYQQKNHSKKKEKQILTTYVSYSEYRVMHKLIESSLVELSGWKLMMDLQKRQDLEKIEVKLQKDKTIEDIFKNS